MDNKKILKEILSSETKINTDAAQKAIENKNADSLISGLSDTDKQKLNSILSDQEALKAALSSPKAKMLLKLFAGGGKNG